MVVREGIEMERERRQGRKVRGRRVEKVDPRTLTVDGVSVSMVCGRTSPLWSCG